jgi:hypothetical protein
VYNTYLAIELRAAATNIPKKTPGTAKKNAYKNIVPNKFVVLYPSALSIPNSKVFYSTSESIREYIS